jgi:hypothetical protein
MPPKRNHTAHMNFPANGPPERHTVQSALAMLRDWRDGSAAAAIVAASLLPFAVAWHVTYVIAIAAALTGAATVALGCHVARKRRLTTLAIYREFAQLPDLAGKRKRLASTRTRRALAAGLRRTAARTQPPPRFDCCPVLGDRVAAARPEILELAAALEQTDDPDPACVALIHELLTNGCSPLYNPNLPAADLKPILARARAGIAAPPPQTHPEQPDA